MTKLRYLTAGESHGPCLTTILEGCPAGLPVSTVKLNDLLRRRQGGYGRGGRMKIEQDTVTVCSGLRFGRTLGSPLTFQVDNHDWKNWTDVMALEGKPLVRREVTAPRPGHADLAGGIKYDHADLRNVLERASARETTMRVVVGGVAQQLLAVFGIEVFGYVTQVGPITTIKPLPAKAGRIQALKTSELACFDPAAEKKMKALIDEAQKKGDSLGGVFEVTVTGVPIGLGSHVQWDRKLDARLAMAVMSLQAVKGVEIGLGFEAARRFGSEAHDEIFYSKRQGFTYETNRAGGLTGGMTNGNPLVVRGALKPIATLYRPLHSVDIRSKKPVKASVERSDTCAIAAASVIAEALVAFEVANAMLEKFGGDSLKEMKRNVAGYLKQVAQF